MSSKRLLTLFCALFLSLGLLAVPASAVTTFTGGASQGTFASKPAAPTVTISNVTSSGKIRLTWNAVSGASSYQIYRSTSKNGTYKLVKTATGTSFTNTSAVAGKTYYYYVVAVAKDGTKSASSAIKSRTCDLAQPVISTSNVASSGKVKVSWDAVENATGYTICIYDADGTLLKTASTTKTSATHSTGVAGVNYTYKVRATCAVDSAASAYSAAKSRTCDLARPEVTVSNVVSSGKVKVSWDKVKGATKYAIYIYDEDGALLKTSTTTKTSATHNSGVAGEIYTYKVRAQCAVSAAASAYSSAETRACNLAQPVITVTTDTSTGKINVSWEPIEGAITYALNIYDYDSDKDLSYYSSRDLLDAINTVGTSFYYSDTYYTQPLSYVFEVQAQANISSANSVFSERKSGHGRLAQPKASAVYQADGKTFVSWKAIEYAEGYTVYIYGKDGKLVETLSTNSAQVIHEHDQAHTAYTYQVMANDAEPARNSVKSVSVSAVYDLQLDYANMTVAEGSEFTLNAAYAGTDKLTWSSGNPSIAIVSDTGKVTAIAEGKATIKVSDGTVSRTCTVTVVPSTTKLVIPISEITLYVGEKYQIPYTYTGSDSVTWTARNTNFIQVSSNGVVTAITEGKTYVTVTDGATLQRIIVNVKKKLPPVEELTLTREDSVFYDGVTRYAGDYFRFDTDIDPIGASSDVTVTSSNADVVSVYNFQWVLDLADTGVRLNFNKPGTAKITVATPDGAISHTYTVHVKDGHDFNPGTRLLTPKEFASYTTRVMCANGFTEDPTLGSWRLFIRTDEELTFENAKKTAYSLIHEWWRNGQRYCIITYEGFDEEFGHVFYAHWG